MKGQASLASSSSAIRRGLVSPRAPALSQCHAAGAASGAYMLRKGQWKYIHYVGFEPELFDLKADPKDIADLAQDPNFVAVLPDRNKPRQNQ